MDSVIVPEVHTEPLSSTQEGDFNLEVKACAEAFQSAQKRTRAAFFLSILASCIVLLMAFNLYEAHRVRNTELVGSNALSNSDYLKEYSKHIADASYYQIPILGIQISCDDVGLLGPLALLVFSLYSVMAFRASKCQVDCVTSAPFAGSRLIRTLVRAEQLPGSLAVQGVLLFLPSLGCVAVIAYGIYAHLGLPMASDPLYEILMKTRTTALTFDALGLILALWVLFYNRQTLQSLKESKSTTDKFLESHPPYGAGIASQAAAGK